MKPLLSQEHNLKICSSAPLPSDYFSNTPERRSECNLFFVTNGKSLPTLSWQKKKKKESQELRISNKETHSRVLLNLHDGKSYDSEVCKLK
jgi:hypothetical protein